MNHLLLILNKVRQLRKQKEKSVIPSRIFLAILTLGIILLIATGGYFLWQSYLDQDIDHFLPGQETVAFVELKNLSLPLKLQNEQIFQQQELIRHLRNLFDIDYNKAFDEWAKGRFGFAMIQIETNNHPVLFLHTNSRKQALSFFEKMTLGGEILTKNEENKNIIYSFPQSHQFVFNFLGPYVFIAKNEIPIKLIQNTHQNKSKNLNNLEDHQKLVSHLPRQNWGRGYINIQMIPLNIKDPFNYIIGPIKHLSDNLAWTIRHKSNGFHFNTLLNINTRFLSLKKGYRDTTRFAYKLTDYINAKDLVAYIGGANLSDEWQNTLDTISNLNPAYGIILEGLIRARITKIFGSDVSLRNDIYPLFEGEYALTFEQDKNNLTNIKLILGHNDIEFVKIKLGKLIKGFRFLAAQFAPKIHIVVLPDGTESRELISDPDRINEYFETYEGYGINCIEISKSIYGFCYTATDQLIVMANRLSSIKETIDLTLSPQFVLSQHQPFRQTLSNLSKVSDEITFINLQKLSGLLKNNQWGALAEPFISPFEAITWVKHYFDDGVSVEGYLLIK